MTVLTLILKELIPRQGVLGMKKFHEVTFRFFISGEIQREKSADSSTTILPLLYSSRGLRAPALLQVRALQCWEPPRSRMTDQPVLLVWLLLQHWPALEAHGRDSWVTATGRQLTEATACLGQRKLCSAGWARTWESPSTIPSAPLCLSFLPSQGSQTATFNPNFPVIALPVCGSAFPAAASFSQGLYKLCPISSKSANRIPATEKVLSILQKNR